ncbi:MAG: Fe-S cluster assembly protein HesB [Propionibacteriales bacterium]|nr:Fe-S cluster assembly protein HesB [Propionibacteriales bacterium]
MSRSLDYLTGDATADALLAADPNALLLGMVLDQQVTMEKAFAGPAVIAERLGGTLDVAKIAAMDPVEFEKLCATRPAIHRFPGAMAKRVQAVCVELVDKHEGSAQKLWNSAGTGAELFTAIKSLPGFGDQKAMIFVALLGKQYGVTPPGWERAAGDYGQDGFRSVADVVDPESLTRVRISKREAKQAVKDAKDAKQTKKS